MMPGCRGQDSRFELLREVVRGPVRRQVPLASYTSWRVGGPAEILVEPQDEDDAGRLFSVFHEHGWPWRLLGAGTNLLVADRGVREVVVSLSALQGIEPLGPQQVRVGAGLLLSKLVKRCVESGWQGIETLGGIPGTVGGAVTMNAGAGDQTVGGCVLAARVVEQGAVRDWPAQRFDFDYRHSAVTPEQAVLAVDFAFDAAEPAAVAQRHAVALAHRRRAQAVHGANAGSVFKNPSRGSAWKLIDACGLRGVRRGGAQVAPEHANFIVNNGDASAADILGLIRQVQAEVYRRMGILLEPEVRLMGDFGEDHES
ncbi:MAG: UDP-N-acetylmuramate dehydrogenase [Desulfuromonadaceae bacterium]|nr:UDP-N-acetylmuramate dehydrogenase [Desulfuromonadaceae bacterium]